MGDYALKGDYVLKGKEIEDVLLANAVKKVKSPLDVTIFAGIVAGILPVYIALCHYTHCGMLKGFWVSLGAIAGISIAGTVFTLYVISQVFLLLNRRDSR